MPNLQKLGRPVVVKEKHRATHPGKLLAGPKCVQQYSMARIDLLIVLDHVYPALKLLLYVIRYSLHSCPSVVTFSMNLACNTT